VSLAAFATRNLRLLFAGIWIDSPVAGLRHTATVEDIDYRHPRGLDKAALLALASCQWIRDHHNCLITGPTGVGKSYLACALAHKACREAYSALYLRGPPASSRNSPSPKATDAIADSLPGLPGSISSCWMTGGCHP